VTAKGESGSCSTVEMSSQWRTGSHAEDAAPGGPVLYRDGRAVGRLRYSDPELTVALNLADGLARSPASIASFLEAAGSAALEQAGKILVRRI